MKPGIFRIELQGQQDELLTIHGEGELDRGVVLSEDGVDTLLTTSPEKQTWKSGARQKGSKPKNRKILHKDIDLEFLVKETDTHTSEQNESYLLQAVGWELDEWDDDAKYARIAVTTDISGTRYLDLVQYEEMDYSPRIDPIAQQFAEMRLKVRCGDPDWYEDDFISAHDFSGVGEGYVEVWNPTPRVVLQTWGLTEGTYTIPDFSWRGPKGARSPGGPDNSRYLNSIQVLATDGYTQIHRDREKLPAENEWDTNITARLNGQFLLYAIPPHTQRQQIPVYKEDAGAGRVELIQARRWPRAWGHELV